MHDNHLPSGTWQRFVVWFTGLPGSGKSTLAEALAAQLRALGVPVTVLDGDQLRQGLCRDLGFSAQDRHEQARRTMYVAQLLFEAGVVPLVALISPYRQDREQARALFPPGRFLEVYLDCPLDILQSRDPKALWRSAREGRLRGLTGWDAPYEAPEDPELTLVTGRWDVSTSLARLWAALVAFNLVPAAWAKAFAGTGTIGVEGAGRLTADALGAVRP
ncbi:MAG: adenylyl-sulfate kinase [Firmicutes bacterium]|nr:adenylyl-sulfate kinase [Alicyclobacillaceae bacterium]MCL6496049.1 adenylyl-sulfate kinase [Bacillota bacterium]